MNIILLGASGSIGTQTLQILRENPQIHLKGFSVHSNLQMAKDIIEEFEPSRCLITSKEAGEIDKKYLKTSILTKEMWKELYTEDIHMVVNAVTGIHGIPYTAYAVEQGLDVALANKESLVSCGELIMDMAKKNGAKIYPVDSEHSAIYQCLRGENLKRISSITLTASGGAFRDFSKEEIEKKDPREALLHPNWKMGSKITVDSATLMNKGFELIEAAWLFGVSMEQVQVVIHRQSVVHSAVHFVDGSIKAQLGKPSMLVPIQYALLKGERKLCEENLSFLEMGKLTFEKVDEERFPFLQICKDALKIGGSAPALINAVNDYYVPLYLKGKISFYQMAKGLREELDRHDPIFGYTVEDILALQKKVWKRLEEK